MFGKTGSKLIRTLNLQSDTKRSEGRSLHHVQVEEITESNIHELYRDMLDLPAVTKTEKAEERFLSLVSGVSKDPKSWTHDDLQFYSDPRNRARFQVEIRAYTLSVLKHRVLFLTDAGYMGVGPATLLPGDDVYALAGGYSPFVLRRAETPECATSPNDITRTHVEIVHQLLGDAYVHGVHTGPFWRGVLHGEGYLSSGYRSNPSWTFWHQKQRQREVQHVAVA